MSLTHFIALWRVETRKLLSRTLGRFGLVVAVLLGLVGPLWLRLAQGSGGEFNGTPVTEMFQMTGADAVLWALTFRNLMVMRLFLVGLVAVAVAGEYNTRTLRDDLVQPVPRWAVVLAKWASQSTWLAIGGALSWLTAMVLGCILFGTGGPWLDAAKAWGVTLLCDTGFAAVALAVAFALRSSIGTLIGMVVFMAVDKTVGLFLWAIETFGRATELPWAMELAIQARPWLPSSAFGVWAAWNGGDPWAWQNFAALAVLSGLGIGISSALLSRMDVP